MGHNSFFDSEDTVEDCDLNIPTTKGVPDIVPFATLETGHYLGLNYLFNDAPRRTQIYCVKSTHLLVLDKASLKKLIKLKDDRRLALKRLFLE